MECCIHYVQTFYSQQICLTTMNTWLFGFIYDTPSIFIYTMKVKKVGSQLTSNWRWCRIETLKMKIKVSISWKGWLRIPSFVSYSWMLWYTYFMTHNRYQNIKIFLESSKNVPKYIMSKDLDGKLTNLCHYYKVMISCTPLPSRYILQPKLFQSSLTLHCGKWMSLYTL